MCGIAGYIERDHAADPEIVSAMTDTLIHRGPDAGGIQCLGPVALGHRRLSIIDLSPAGRQPMSDEQAESWIVFNGEFYNFQEYREELLAEGVRFQSKTDTEVILYLYKKYGLEGMVSRLRGMFAFAIYDRPAGKLFLVRDRLGIKPCYYTLQDGVFAWGSELKALLRHPRVRAAIRPEGVRDYFLYSYVPDPDSIYHDIYKLMPGHYLEFDISGFSLSTKQYWDVEFAPDHTVSEDECLEELDALLEESVRCRLISDVPFGAFLSGGIDSTLTVAYMARIMDQPVKTFSIGFTEQGFDELPWARQVASRFGTEHHEQTVTPDAVELLPRLAHHFDEPFGDHSAVPTYYVSAMARERITVVLSGDGGDENFAGYDKYGVTEAIARRRAQIPSWIRSGILRPLVGLYPGEGRGRGLLDMLVQPDDDIYHTKMLFFNRHNISRLLPGSACMPADVGGGQVKDRFHALNERMQGLPALSRMQYIDLKTYLPMDILTKVDRASMAVALETRVPILDHKMVEWAARVPAELHCRNGVKKYLLKRVLQEKFGFDTSFLDRPKHGFDLPVAPWFQGALQSHAREVLLSPNSLSSLFLNQQYIRGMLGRDQRQMQSKMLWSILMFEHWLRAAGERDQSCGSREYIMKSRPGPGRDQGIKDNG
jgi:asparagine synthase (glutamine-hydrolysing)